MLEYLSLIAASLVLLIVAADYLVRASSRIATLLGISPLVVGLTFVAFGTSAPEFAVSLTAARAGSSDIAVANVVGSNIFNVLAILGLSALIAPLSVSKQLIRIDLPIMIGVSILLFFLSTDGRIDLLDSSMLSCLIVAYTLFLISEARRMQNLSVMGSRASETKPSSKTLSVSIIWLLGGLGGLFVGSRLLVHGAINLVRLLDVSEAIIGLTIVAVGTSLPELAASVVAALKGERDIAIGNIVGSNIFNVCSVVGFAGLASAGNLTVAPHLLALDIPLMIAVALLCLPFFRTGYVLTRANGAVFLAWYALYMILLILRELQSQAFALFQTILLDDLLPILVIGTVVVTVREMRKEPE